MKQEIKFQLKLSQKINRFALRGVVQSDSSKGQSEYEPQLETSSKRQKKT